MDIEKLLRIEHPESFDKNMNDGYSIANMTVPHGSCCVKMLRSVVVENCPGVQVGDLIMVPNSVAMCLINMGAAERAEAPKSEPVVENADPVVETRDPEPDPTPKRRGRPPAQSS